MKAKDVVVGRLYSHVNHDGTIYLGVCDTHKIPRKSLVVVVAGDSALVGVGCSVISRTTLRRNFNNEKFWDGFVPVLNHKLALV